MALIPCPECELKISTRALKCPHCGYPLENVFNENSQPEDIATLDEDDSDSDEKYTAKIENSEVTKNNTQNNVNKPHDPTCECQQCNFYRRENSNPVQLVIFNRIISILFIGLGSLIMLAFALNILGIQEWIQNLSDKSLFKWVLVAIPFALIVIGSVWADFTGKNSQV